MFIWFCCRRLFSFENLIVRIFVISLASIFGAALAYGILIGYACLWLQYIAPHIGTGDAGCKLGTDKTAYGMYVLYGVAYLFMTGTLIVVALSVVVGIAVCLFFFGRTCWKWCANAYIKAEEDVERHKATETTALIVSVKVDTPAETTSLVVNDV